MTVPGMGGGVGWGWQSSAPSEKVTLDPQEHPPAPAAPILAAACRAPSCMLISTAKKNPPVLLFSPR